MHLSTLQVDIDLPEWQAVFCQVFFILLLHKNMLQKQLHHDYTTPQTSANKEKIIYLSATNTNW